MSAWRSRRRTWCTRRPMWRRRSAFRQALHRRQHHPVRGRPVADRERGGRAGLRHHQRQRRAGRPRHEGAADLGPRAAHAAGLHGAGRHHQDREQLKGKRLSATGGGVGGFNWRMGRAVLRSVGLDVNDAQFIPSPTAGRLPGLIANQVDAVALHPEDVFLAQRQKPTLQSAGAARRADAALHVQRLWRVARPGSSATGRCCATPSRP